MEHQFILAACFVFVGFLLLHQRYGAGLQKIPGPIIASFTDLWRFFVVWSSEMPQQSLRLHRKHGPLVRLGPRYVSASSREAIHAVYRAGTGFQKVSQASLETHQLPRASWLIRSSSPKSMACCNPAWRDRTCTICFRLKIRPFMPISSGIWAAFIRSAQPNVESPTSRGRLKH